MKSDRSRAGGIGRTGSRRSQKARMLCHVDVRWLTVSVARPCVQINTCRTERQLSKKGYLFIKARKLLRRLYSIEALDSLYSNLHLRVSTHSIDEMN